MLNVEYNQNCEEYKLNKAILFYATPAAVSPALQRACTSCVALCPLRLSLSLSNA